MHLAAVNKRPSSGVPMSGHPQERRKEPDKVGLRDGRICNWILATLRNSDSLVRSSKAVSLCTSSEAQARMAVFDANVVLWAKGCSSWGEDRP